MRFASLLTVLLVPLFAGAVSMLDEFESDVNFLERSYAEVRKAGVKSVFRDEYRSRITMANDRAYKIQRSAQKLGIPRVTLQTTMNKLISCVQIRGVSAGGLARGSGSVGEHAAELRRQIKYLRSLNYSYESGTFENPYPDSGTYEAVHHYNNLFRQLYQEANRKNRVQKSNVERFNEKCEDFKRLGQSIALKVQLDKIKTPGDFNLTVHMDAFLQSAEKLLEQRAKRDNSDVKKLIKSKNYRETQSRLDYAAGRLEVDIDFMKRMNFSMRIRRHDLQPVYQTPGRSKDEIDGSKPRLDYAGLWKLYTETKNELFRSESKLRGVSEEFYQKYRALLTEPQKKELDALAAQYTAEELSAELSRSMAVKKLHTKYQYRQNAYSEEELERILRENGALK